MFPDDEIRAAAAETDILQHHVHILLDALQLHRKRVVLRRVVRELQTHDGNGRFDLVHPRGVVVQHVLPLGVGLGCDALHLGAEGGDHSLIVLLRKG